MSQRTALIIHTEQQYHSHLYLDNEETVRGDLKELASGLVFSRIYLCLNRRSYPVSLYCLGAGGRYHGHAWMGDVVFLLDTSNLSTGVILRYILPNQEMRPTIGWGVMA